MNKKETATIEGVIKRLEGEKCNYEIRAILNRPDMQCFLKSWVIAPLNLLVKENRSRFDLDLAKNLSI